MAKRQHVNLLYQYNEKWIGGAYYIINIIKSFHLLEENQKPIVNIYYDCESSIESINNIKYPYIKLYYFDFKFTLIEKIVNRISLDFFGKILITKKVSKNNIKSLYPVNPWINVKKIEKSFYWIPDMQERYLPNFFSKRDVKNRIKIQKNIIDKKYPIVFSSYNALGNFDEFYPNVSNKKYVIKFVSSIGKDYSNLSINELKNKFSIPEVFFMSPNQFWQHKNQIIIIKAVKILKDQGVNVSIVFTGKEYDYRNPNYANNLKKTISENNLSDNFIFLGFIDRDEQLQLMKNSHAIIQPSLFEGWSTVVEDTKALNHVIILSDIPLHKEQIKDNCIFFNPLDEFDLADKIVFSLNHDIKTTYFNLDEAKTNFAKNIISVFSE